MARFFTADLHLGHLNIIRYCDRPFADVDEMNEALIRRWNETVGDGDEVIALGDVAMGRLDDTLPLVRRLRGRKVLLAGNHDRCWAGHSKGVEEGIARYLDVGFAEIWQGVVPLDLGGVPVLACHFPYRGDSQDRDRYLAHRPVDEGTWLLHGHVHERWKVHERMINVGVDVWDPPPRPRVRPRRHRDRRLNSEARAEAGRQPGFLEHIAAHSLLRVQGISSASWAA